MAASEILGLFTTPEQYQQNQLAQARSRAFQEVQLDPFQQAALGARSAGYQFGQAVGGALGGQDPQLQLIARRQQLASQLNPNDPNSYMRVAKIASDAGDQQFAIAISDAGRKAMSEYALIEQRTRERQGADPFQQIIRSGKYTPASLSAYQKSQNVADLVLLDKEGATPNEIQIAARLALQKGVEGTPEFNTEFNAQLTRLTTKEQKDVAPNVKEVGVAEVGIRRPVYLDVIKDEQFTYQKGADGKQIRVPYFDGVDRTTAKVSATSSTAQETEFSKDLGKADAERVKNAMNTRENSIGTLNSLNRLNELNQQDLISGSFATGRVGATNFLSTLGLASGKDVDRLSASENYQKTAGDVILATLGGKLGAGFSNEDRKFIQSLVPQLENSPQARKQLIEFMVGKNQSIVEETTRLEDYARDKKSLKGYVPKIPIINLQGGSIKPPSQMSRQELLDAIEAKKRQPQ
jgi:hypothetical protein